MGVALSRCATCGAKLDHSTAPIQFAPVVLRLPYSPYVTALPVLKLRTLRSDIACKDKAQ